MLPYLLAITFLASSSFINAQIIPRDLLFSEPKYSSVSLSPDGTIIAYLAPNEKGINNIFTKCVTCKNANIVTFENKRHINDFQWTAVPNIILYSQDTDGDENDKLYKLNITNVSPQNKPYVISDRPGVKAAILTNNKIDRRVLIALNDENPAYHNIYEFDLYTNKMTRIFHNTRFSGAHIIVDNDLQIRLVAEDADDGSLIYSRPSSKANPRNLTSDINGWVQYLKVPHEDREFTTPLAFTGDNKRIYWRWGAGSDLGQLVIHDFGHPDANEIIYSAVKTEIVLAFFHPATHNLLALTEVYHKQKFIVVNNTILDDLQYLENFNTSADLGIASISLDLRTWLVAYISDDKPTEYYLYRRSLKKVEYLFTDRPELVGKKLNKMNGFSFKARDGLQLQAYLSLPPQSALLTPAQVNGSDAELAKLGILPVQPQPMIVFVHGGPNARDFFGFSPFNAWLTNRGYVVLQVNFRGSTGFGKTLRKAGNGEWGRKMHYDLLDAVNFSIAKGIADKNRIAIAGASYGGYATLAGLTFTPDVFACGVDIVGPSNLASLLENIPPYWSSMYKDLTTSLGADIKTEEGREFLKSRSPLFFANQVKKPLLIFHGANDPRVKQSQADQFVDALKNNSIPVTYVLYPDEGHGIRKAQNNLAMTGYIEEFLHKCLKGNFEPLIQGQYNSSDIVMASPEKNFNLKL